MTDFDGMKKCFLFDGCPGRTGVCYACGPDGDECPIYRWFKAQILKEQPQWISVKDRLPETRHAVLVYTPYHKNIWAASMHEDGNWYIWSPCGREYLDSDWYGPITHWMPLPEPPEESNHETINH